MSDRKSRGGAPEAQKERAEATRGMLLAAARAAFGEAGFHATGTNEIVDAIGLTRGALYHHFAGKEGLFAAVFEEVAEDLVSQSNASVAGLSGDLWAQVCTAFCHYLDLVAVTDEYQRILLVDGPAVLGWKTWREMMGRFVASGTRSALEMLMDKGLVRQQPVAPLANLLQAALGDAALEIANSSNPAETKRLVTDAFLTILSGLRQTDPSRSAEPC